MEMTKQLLFETKKMNIENSHKTSHILHLILTLLTGLLWLLPWILIADHNGGKKRRALANLEKEFGIMGSNRVRHAIVKWFVGLFIILPVIMSVILLIMNIK